MYHDYLQIDTMYRCRAPANSRMRSNCTYIRQPLTKHSTHWCVLAGVTDLQRYPSEHFGGSKADQGGRLHPFLREHPNIHRNRSHCTELPSVWPDPILHKSPVEIFWVESLESFNFHVYLIRTSCSELDSPVGAGDRLVVGGGQKVQQNSKGYILL